MMSFLQEFVGESDGSDDNDKILMRLGKENFIGSGIYEQRGQNLKIKFRPTSLDIFYVLIPKM